jgi:hypothetical protein
VALGLTAEEIGGDGEALEIVGGERLDPIGGREPGVRVGPGAAVPSVAAVVESGGRVGPVRQGAWGWTSPAGWGRRPGRARRASLPGDPA